MIKLVIFDLDNTLYDWIGFYIPSFLAMVREISRISGHPIEQIKRAFKLVHEQHRSTEYAFAIEELENLDELSATDRLLKYRPAIQVFQEKRSELLHLYDGVIETLSALRARGIELAAITDTTTYYSSKRLQQLGVDEFFDLLCAPEDHGIPPHIPLGSVRKYQDPNKYLPSVAKVLALPADWRKPDTRILDRVLTSAAVHPRETMLVGDSLSRDIRMAKNCGVWSVHALYGCNTDPPLVSELLQITYWKQADVAAAERDAQVTPDFVINSFSELLTVIDNVDKGTANPSERSDTT